MLKGCTPSENASKAFYDQDRRREIRAVYYAMIAEFDAMVGQYMQAGKDAGVWENTVFIVTSDHGDMQMEKQQFYKMVPYEASSSVPMVIHDGRSDRREYGSDPQIIRETTQLIDIFPTVMDLASIPSSRRPKELDGVSLSPY